MKRGPAGAIMTTEGDDSDNADAEMAECGACRTVIPVDSTSCSSCGVSFTGVAEDEMGECGACGALVELGSKSCSQCGVHFVLDDLTTALTDWMKEEGISITDLFGKVDTDGDGSLSTDEIKQSLLDRSLAFLPHNDLDRFLAQIDLNSDGGISLGELAAALSMPFTAAKPPVVLEPVEEETEEEAEEEAESEDKPEEAEEESKAESDEEASEEDEDDEAEEEESDAEETDDVDEGEDSDDGDDEAGDDDDDEEDDTDSAVVAFTRLIEAVEASSESARGLFEKLDRNESDNVDSDEFKDAVRELMDDDFSDEDLDSIISAMDTDDDGHLDIIEITSALEDSEKVIEEIEKPKREGPADWQRFMMRHYENVFPILYTVGVLFIGLWIVNALGVMNIDGSGGPVAYDGDSPHPLGLDDDSNTIFLQPGEIYDCDATIQKTGCQNSLTPFAGEASSMPAGFYWDGIMFMVLGLLGLGGIGYLQMQIKGLRAEHRREKSEDDDDEDSDSDDDADEESDDDEDSDSDDDADEESDNDEESDEADDSSEDDEDEEEESEEAEDDGEEGTGIEIGTRVGVEDEDGDWFGVVTEFDEDEDGVVVKREDDDEEYLVEWDSLFLED